MSNIGGHWSSRWPAADQLVLGQELLRCWASCIRTFWPATANPLQLQWGLCELSCGRPDMRIVQEDLTTEKSRDCLCSGAWRQYETALAVWHYITGGKLPLMVCDRKDDESGDRQSF